MDLPKNITQIGETDGRVKIYVEDYAVSYIKQFNKLAQNKEIAVALYGNKTEEDGITYLFLYGACKLDFLQKETRHLSQAQKQEIDQAGKFRFPEYEFLAYGILNGEMVDGFYVYTKEINRYVTGYAQFYEKNDRMLSFLLEIRKDEIQPEYVNYEKYNGLQKKKSKEKDIEINNEEKSETKNNFAEKKKMRAAKLTIAACFGVALVMSVNAMGKEKGWNLRQTLNSFWENLNEKKLPDENEELLASGYAVNDVVDHSKTEAAADRENTYNKDMAGNDREEDIDKKDAAEMNATVGTEEREVTTAPTEEDATSSEVREVTTAPTEKDAASPEVRDGTTAQTEEDTTSPEVGNVTTTPTEEGSPETKTSEEEPCAESPVAYMPNNNTIEEKEENTSETYIVKQGDTLNGICLKIYGGVNEVKTICSMNDIQNPDEIKEGQKIFLP